MTTAKNIHRAIARIVKLNQSHRGVVAAVTAALAKATGQPQHRQEVGVWLHPDKAKRIEPRLTTGLQLAAACEAVLADHKRRSFQRRAK
jgi:hypothetical protein